MWSKKDANEYVDKFEQFKSLINSGGKYVWENIIFGQPG
jgi:hypothetical protein